MKRWLLRFNAWIAALLILALVAGLGWLSARYVYSTQLADARHYELSEPSRKLLGALQGDAQIVAFVTPGHPIEAHVRELLARYSAASPKVQVALYNPEQYPDKVRELGIERMGEMILQYDDRRERVLVPNEARIGEALERLLRGKGQFIAFLTGHGERDLLGQGQADLGLYGQWLQRKGYRLQPVDLTRFPAVPDNSTLLVLAGPRAELPVLQQAQIARYLERGGNLLVLADPDSVPRLRFLEGLLPLRWREAAVRDPGSAAKLSVNDPSLLWLSEYPDHPALEALAAPSVLREAAAFELQPQSDWQARPLLTLQGEQSLSTGEARGAMLGASFSRRQDGGEQRVVVIGDSDAFSDLLFKAIPGNRGLGLGVADWLTGSGQFIGTAVAGAPDQALELGDWQRATLGLGFLVVLPLLFAALGGLSWWRRRRG